MNRRKALGAAVAALTATALLVVPASAAVPENAGLQAMGPIAEHGFPAWYSDKTGLRLEPCLDTAPADLCGLVADGFTGVASMPDHFPDEFFYNAAVGELDVGNLSAQVETALEGAFALEVARPGDQITFGRIRIRVDGLQAGETYRVVHPYGQEVFTAEGGEINFTEDIGIGTNNFSGALNSRLGPFLRWDTRNPAPPDGYVGDPNAEHTFTGSPYNTNYFQLIGPDVAAGAPSNALCNPLPVGVAATDCIQQAQWSILGKKAVNADVAPESAIYTRNTDGTDGGTILVHATSDDNEVIVVENGALGDQGHVARRQMYGSHGRYVANVSYAGQSAPGTLTIRNLSDTPVATRTVKVVDGVNVTAATWLLNAAGRPVLAVRATSTDPAAKLTLHGPAGTSGAVDSTGLARILNLEAPPLKVTVRSDKGGSIEVPVKATVTPTPILPPTAAPVHPTNVQPRASVALDATKSIGMGALTYAWSQVNADGTPFKIGLGQDRVVIAAPSEPATSFLAPLNPGTVHLALKVTDQTGLSATVRFQVAVDAPASPLAVAVGRLDGQIGSTVTLDGSGSLNVVRYRWAQVQIGSNPMVTLVNPTSPKATFTMPRLPDPAVPLHFRLTVSGGDGTTHFVTVQVFQVVDDLAITSATYDAPDLRVRGTSSVATGTNTVTLTVRNTATSVSGTLGPVTVDQVGDWQYRGPLPAGVTGNAANLRIDAVSGAGSQVLNYAVTAG
ncbi:hypothetical protein [Micromonospora cremea]|uniref:Uncharacterized protein n=1 Tax=Micromonospora cremea TaxID=709881 RepID=A0A1N5ZWW0_9ACTN|nr:hypothetical protein [Micromonospora cremea]SIN26117.1 hypothetical protein SAMN04489832_4561 [Micromonospora cremea]